jgi:hypothetical protein
MLPESRRRLREKGKAVARPKNQRRADYFLYTWQIRAIREIANARQVPASAVVRELLTLALAAQGHLPRDPQVPLAR